MSTHRRRWTTTLCLLGAAGFAMALGASGCGDDETGDGAGGTGNSGSGGEGNLCGNGLPDPDLGEECDDGNLDETDRCKSDCTLTFCGDGIVQPETEACDDGNQDDGDACLSTCFPATCGDGIIQVGVESCDDGNEEDGDACSSTCAAGSGCGNGVTEAGEACDDGNKVNSDACLNTCELNTCGDGFAHIDVEACDDGNQINDDTCDNTCNIPSVVDYSCPGVPLNLAANGEVSAQLDTTGLADNYDGSCGGIDSPEIVFEVIPAGSGTLDIAMGGLSGASDPVLYARSGSCGSGTELGCSDSTFGGGTESLVFPVTGGTPYYIFADGWEFTQGPFILTANLLTTVPGDDCPGIPIQLDPNETEMHSSNTAAAGAQRVGLGLCASGNTPEIVYQITPNANGTVYAALAPDSYDASLYGRTTCTSQASQFGCAEAEGPGGLEVLSVPVTAGTKVWFFVDGYEGESGAYDVEFTLVP